MAKTNLQIRLDDETAHDVDQLSGSSRSSFVREAIVEKIQRERARRLEMQWVEALKKTKTSPADEDRDWMKAESWEKK